MEDSNAKTKNIIAVVVIILVAVLILIFSTYAFFTFFAGGEKSNNLITGRIKLAFIEGENNITLSNQFPISDVEAVDMMPSEGDISLTTFSITGYASGENGLNYRLTGLAGDSETGRNRMKDSDIKIYLTGVQTLGDNTSSLTISNGFSNAANDTYGVLASVGHITQAKDENGNLLYDEVDRDLPIYLDTKDKGEILLAEGIMGQTATTHTYTLKMWISDNVTISDTDTSKTYCASTSECSGNRNVYSTMYYSLKLKVETFDSE